LCKEHESFWQSEIEKVKKGLNIILPWHISSKRRIKKSEKLKKCPVCQALILSLKQHVAIKKKTCKKHESFYQDQLNFIIKKYNTNYMLSEIASMSSFFSATDISKIFRLEFGNTIRKTHREIVTKQHLQQIAKGIHNFCRKMPWGIEKNDLELNFDNECRKRGLDPLDEKTGWEIPRCEYFNGDFLLRVNGSKQYALRPDRINRQHKIWIEIDEYDHKYSKKYDALRDEFLIKHSWKVLRFSYTEIGTSMDLIVNKIRKSLE
jgi:very-short-patch-repair endonuclease